MTFLLETWPLPGVPAPKDLSLALHGGLSCTVMRDREGSPQQLCGGDGTCQAMLPEASLAGYQGLNWRGRKRVVRGYGGWQQTGYTQGKVALCPWCGRDGDNPGAQGGASLILGTLQQCEHRCY